MSDPELPTDDEQDEGATVPAEEEALRFGESAKVQAQTFLRTVGRNDTADLLDDDLGNEDALGQLRDFGALGEDLIGRLKVAGEIKARRFEEQEREIAQSERESKLDARRRQRQEARREAEEKARVEAEEQALDAQLDAEEHPEGAPSGRPEEQIYAQFGAVMDQFNSLPPTDLEARAALADKGIDLARQLEHSPDNPITFDTEAFLAKVNEELEGGALDG